MKADKLRYTVWAATGMHEERRKWDVATYYDIEIAEKHCKLCNEFVKKEIDPLVKEWKIYFNGHNKPPKNPYDPAMYVDTDPLEYNVLEHFKEPEPYESFDAFMKTKENKEGGLSGVD